MTTNLSPRDAALQLIDLEERWLGLEALIAFTPDRDAPQMPHDDLMAEFKRRRDTLTNARALIELSPDVQWQRFERAKLDDANRITAATAAHRARTACKGDDVLRAYRLITVVIHLTPIDEATGPFARDAISRLWHVRHALSDAHAASDSEGIADALQRAESALSQLMIEMHWTSTY